MTYLRFADEFVEPLLEGEKTHTVRYQFERPVRNGAVVDLVDERGKPFAKAKVWTVVRTNIHGAFLALDTAPELESPASPEALADSLSTYYPADLDRKSPVTLIRFSVVESLGGAASNRGGVA